jgi:uncharacterized cofD-like protein
LSARILTIWGLTALGLAVLFVAIVVGFGAALGGFVLRLTEGTDRALLGFASMQDLPTVRGVVAVLLAVVGVGLLVHSFRQAFRGLTRVINPKMEGRVMDAYMRKRSLLSGPRVVVIGGGTGLSTLLRGLKQRTSNITAIVTVADDGGHSGLLRREMGMIPPGDIRNCLVALADAEPAMTALFQHRFDQRGGGMAGHSIGNLLIAAMADIEGDFEKGVKKLYEVLNIRGMVLPSTLAHVTLRAEMEDGSLIDGETAIVESPLRIRKVSLVPADPPPLEEALDAIRNADIIVIGPGSVYTSVIPNLLVRGMTDAIAASKAVKVYACNVMTQPGESDGFTAADHVRAIEAHTGRHVFQYVIVNKAIPGEALIEKYRASNQELVVPDADRLRAMGLKPVVGDFISETDVVRHDPVRLTEAILRVGGAKR